MAIPAATISTAAVADTEYEWDSTWGMHEEEWYDPSDWFNDDNKASYETADSYSYDDDYYDDDVWNSYDYYGDYAYDYSYYDPAVTGYNYYYQWNPVDYVWTEVSGDKSNSEQMQAKAKDNDNDNDNDKKKHNIDKKDVLTIKGTIKSVGKAKTKDGNKEHHFVVIEPATGKQILVDFGSNAMPAKVKLEEGNTIQVRGPRTKLDGQYVLVAQQVSTVK